MTIKEIAEVLNVSRDLIEKRIKELFPGKMMKGVTTHLNEAEVTMVKLRIQENSSLITSDDRRKLPKTNLEKELIIQQAQIYQQEKVAALIEENKRLLPKAQFFDRVTDSTSTFDMGEAAKVLNLGMGRNALFLYLRHKKVLMANNEPYQKYIDLGYFRVIEQEYTQGAKGTKVKLKTLVYQKGINFILKLWGMR